MATGIVNPQLRAGTAFFTRDVALYAIQAGSDANLAAVRRQDRDARNAKGIITRLSADEHLRRAGIYHVNRAFVEAREHWQALIN